MIDPFLLLTPILLLPIIWLLRFTGCAAILGIDDVTYASLFAVKTTSPTVCCTRIAHEAAEEPLDLRDLRGTCRRRIERLACRPH